jgi:anti-sigma factor RsiW
MPAETQRLTDGERANLVAYLDGELTEPERRTLSTKITQSVTARREIESLQRTWELLDYLPRPEAADDFATRTMTVALDQGGRGAKASAIVGRARVIAARVAVLGGVAASTLAVGYIAGRWAWPDPSTRLVRDLPIAEHLEEYREVGSYDFLRLLENSPAFAEDAE